MSPLPPSPSLAEQEVSTAPVQENSIVWMREVIPRFPREIGRVGWIVYTALSCLFFIVITFPADLLLQRIAIGITRGTSWRVQYAEGILTWRGECLLRDVILQQSTSPPVRIPRLVLQPSLLSLIFGRPWPLQFTANLAGGTLTGVMNVDPSGQSIQFTAARLDLRLLPLPGVNKGETVQGILDGEGELQGHLTDVTSLRGQLTLTVKEGALPAGSSFGLPLPPITSANVQLRATVKNGLVNITDLTLRAANAEAQLHGSVALVTPWPMSTLNLQMTASAREPASSALTMLLSLLPRDSTVPGGRRALISGSFAAPVLR